MLMLLLIIWQEMAMICFLLIAMEIIIGDLRTRVEEALFGVRVLLMKTGDLPDKDQECSSQVFHMAQMTSIVQDL
jgi:hypothetical protein